MCITVWKQAALALTHGHNMLLPPTHTSSGDKNTSSGSSAACRCSVKRCCRQSAVSMWRRCWGQSLWRLLRGCCKTSSLPQQRMLPSSSFFRPALTQRPICSASQKQMAVSPVISARRCARTCCPEQDSTGEVTALASAVSAPLMECHVGCRRIAPDGVAGAGSGPGCRHSGRTGRSDRPVGLPPELPPGSCLATKVSCTRMTSLWSCWRTAKYVSGRRASERIIFLEKRCNGPAALRLEALVEDLAGSEAVHPGFRLWLSSMPSPGFPPSVLQAGLKLAVQPPRGIRATLVRTYSAMTNDAFEASPSSLPDAWKHLLLGISFFHATVQVCTQHTWTTEPEITERLLFVISAALPACRTQYTPPCHAVQ